MQTRTIILSCPIRRNGGDLETLTLRAPRPDDIRGLFLVDLLKMDTTTLLPRISVDGLTGHEARQLAFADVIKLGGEVIGFAIPLIKTEGAK
ncbi:phage tail assembly protein [Meridianimarinicoccus aquatilis]|uniref:Phage tail assembly protein n=1 Tax=Meridianimarinicoccus aquatilis TaxID=2552766 RepID=A0A4R6AKR2_9RHOB|nr:phage tail assembly protein [Fluviibacterium aquatile]TDL83902.1 phage tail assembly protein [Fluviibacterium aquatile]